MVALLLSATDGVVAVTTLEDTTVDGVAYPTLQFRTAVGGPVVMLVDPRTSDVRSLRYPTDASPSAPQAREWFDDYRPVSGLRVAFKATVEREGATISRSITRLTINGALPAAAFVRKEA